jgi:predicted O-linked N-acetylglucosamine transferase (SPINDLY family)
MSWQDKAYINLQEENYQAVIELYEKSIQSEPETVSHYWHLGLAYLLDCQEEEAQATWLFAMANGTEQENISWTQELANILEVEAQRQSSEKKLDISWLIRRHLQEISPNNVDNTLSLIDLSLSLNEFGPRLLEDWNIINLIHNTQTDHIDVDLLLTILVRSINFPSTSILDLIDTSLSALVLPQAFTDTLVTAAMEFADQSGRSDFAVQVTERCLKCHPNSSHALQYLYVFYDRLADFKNSFKAADNLLSVCHDLPDRLLASYLRAKASIHANGWLESGQYISEYKILMRALIEAEHQEIKGDTQFSLILTPQLLPYIQDNPQENLWFQNRISDLFQKSFKSYAHSNKSNHKERRPLKIGYIGHTLKAHSVGWLSRWLLQHHDKSKYEVFIYFINQNSENSFSQMWFKDKASSYLHLDDNPQKAAAQIKNDQIDILVDLDSTTFNGTCIVMALKPAPIQVTWLGRDASGIPAIDYFIADPYVLAENAQQYYQEKIWRLPQTYVAVDGFEVGVPTLRRDQLGIPSDAVIYYTAQNGLKRHPDTVRLQIQILREVPNSHLLIKGRSDEVMIQKLFTQLANEESIDCSRLHFLPRDANEYTHRANLAIADVVLDTYPYNGATTTLETLWMAIPLVTRVGQQFAARNSYAFMMNVGIEEGIAWTDAEYIEWGVRFGREPDLRRNIAWQLELSKQTSPLWNARQFAQEMEKAYQQMWEDHQQHFE